MICRIGKIGGTHVYFKTCWEDIITAAMADPFCDRLGSEDDSTDLCGCQRDPYNVASKGELHINDLIIATVSFHAEQVTEQLIING